MAVVNAYALYCLANKSKPLLEFRRTITRDYLHTSIISNPKHAGRPCLQKLSQNRFPDDVRRDPVDIQMSHRRTSEIWKHFNPKASTRSECNYCKLILSIAGGSFGNLKRHLRSKHPTVRLKTQSNPSPSTSISEPIKSSTSTLSYFGRMSNKLPNNKITSRRTSKIWNHFKPKEVNRAECNYCHRPISTRGGSFGNLKRHLKMKHPTVLQEIGSNPSTIKLESTPSIPRSRSPSEESSMSKLSYFSSSSFSATDPISSQKMEICEVISQKPLAFDFTTEKCPLTQFVEDIKPLTLERSEAIHVQLLKMLCKEYHTFNLVGDPEFKKFVAILCPGYSLPNPYTLSQSLLPQAYEEMANSVKINLSKATAIALSIDRPIRINNHSFVAIAAHYISPGEGTSLCSNLLGCVEFSAQHTADNLTEILQIQCVQWDIEDKITAIITANVTNIIAAVRKTQWKHIPCYVHTLHLIVKATVKPIESIIEKFKSIVQFFKKSSHALSKLRLIQKQMGMSEMKLKDVTMRWNHTYEMLKKVSINKVPIISALAILEYDQIKISGEEWEIIQDTLSILHIFEEITIELSSDKSVSYSKAMILTRILYDYISDFNKSKNFPNLVTEMCTVCLQKISEKLISKENPEMMYQAALIDPRFKKAAFKNETKYREVYDDFVEQIQTQINAERLIIAPETSAPTISSTSRLWEKYDKKVITAETNAKAAATFEMDTFIAEPLLPRLSDPLFWWEQKKLLYPHLYKIALEILCVPASAVPFERMFSKAGQCFTEKRSRIDTSKIAKMLFLNSNSM